MQVSLFFSKFCQKIVLLVKAHDSNVILLGNDEGEPKSLHLSKSFASGQAFSTSVLDTLVSMVIAAIFSILDFIMQHTPLDFMTKSGLKRCSITNAKYPLPLFFNFSDTTMDS